MKKSNRDKLARFFTLAGTVILLVTVLLCVPFTIPKLFGLQLYAVKTGSMEPVYPAGSIIYIKEAQASEIKVGDAITYRLGTDTEYVMTHRVISVLEKEQKFLTQGDANEVPDAEPIAFSRLIGKPIACIPHIAVIAGFFHSVQGRWLFVSLFLLAFVFWLSADCLKKKSSEAKQKKWQSSTLLLMLGGIALIVGALAILVPMLLDRKNSNDTYEMLRQMYVKQADSNQENSNQESQQEGTQQGSADGREETASVSIDWAELKTLNPDVVGWLRFDNIETIDYPILYSGDDTTYLHTDIYGKEADAGCIFMEGANHSDLSDYHTIIYGHNMRDLTMFGELKNYKKEGFYEENPYFTIYTEGLNYRYHIFAYRDVSEFDSVYTVGFIADETYQNFLEEQKKRSYIDTGVEVTKDDKIVTLSTCSTTGNRFVVHAVLEEVWEAE